MLGHLNNARYLDYFRPGFHPMRLGDDLEIAAWQQQLNYPGDHCG